VPDFFLVPWAGPKKPSPMASIIQGRVKARLKLLWHAWGCLVGSGKHKLGYMGRGWCSFYMYWFLAIAQAKLGVWFSMLVNDSTTFTSMRCSTVKMYQVFGYYIIVPFPCWWDMING
jgi:hypothetical protein